MANRTMIATKTRRYGTRMLTAGEEVTLTGPQARLASALGYVRDSEGPKEPDDLTTLRAAYKDKIGKQAYHGWDAATLRAKMAEADKA